MEIKEITVSQRELEGVFTQWARDMAEKDEKFLKCKDMWERCREDPEKIGKSFTRWFLQRLAAFAEKEASNVPR